MIGPRRASCLAGGGLPGRTLPSAADMRFGVVAPSPRPNTPSAAIKSAGGIDAPPSKSTTIADAATARPAAAGRRRPRASPTLPPIGLIRIIPIVSAERARPIGPASQPRASRMIGVSNNSAYWVWVENACAENPATNTRLMMPTSLPVEAGVLVPRVSAGWA